MPKSPKQEARALSADERELVAKSRPPALQSLTDTQLATLLKRTRERRNRARTVADRQRRELRGKAAGARRDAEQGRRRLAAQTVGPDDRARAPRRRDATPPPREGKDVARRERQEGAGAEAEGWPRTVAVRQP